MIMEHVLNDIISKNLQFNDMTTLCDPNTTNILYNYNDNDNILINDKICKYSDVKSSIIVHIKLILQSHDILSIIIKDICGMNIIFESGEQIYYMSIGYDVLYEHLMLEYYTCNTYIELWSHIQSYLRLDLLQNMKDKQLKNLLINL
jgi:hypothetical protein